MPLGDSWMFKKKLLLPLLSLLIPLAASFAQPIAKRENVETRLKELRGQIEKESGRLEEIKKRQGEISGYLEKVTAELKKTSDQHGAFQGALENLQQKAKATEDKLGALELKAGKFRESLRERAVAIYKMQRRTSALDYLVRASSVTDLLTRSRYLAVVARYDRKKLDELKGSRNELQAARDKFADLKRRALEQLAELKKIEDDLEAKKFKQATLLQDAKEQERQQERSIAKLKIAAENMEKILSQLMGGEEAPTTPTEAPTGIGVPKPTVPSPQLLPFSGPGLGSLKGKLDSPVDGKLVQRFGKQRHEEFDDVLFVKGLEYSSGVGARVRAVAPGKVVLNEVLPGFGNVVIVDHGQRYYSLYGRLASSLCQVGDVLKKGDMIAILGQSDHRGRNFYFELRVKGQAVDPLEYLKKGAV